MGHASAIARTTGLTIPSLQTLDACYNGLTPFWSFNARTLTRLTRHLQDESKFDTAQRRRTIQHPASTDSGFPKSICLAIL